LLLLVLWGDDQMPLFGRLHRRVPFSGMYHLPRSAYQTLGGDGQDRDHYAYQQQWAHPVTNV